MTDRPSDRPGRIKRVVIETDDEVSIWERFVPDDEEPAEALCGGCGANTVPQGRPWEWYMVHNHIWETVMRSGPSCQYLCIGCLEDRLGRHLAAEDFSDLSINEPGWNDTERLAGRKRSTGADLH